MLDVHAPHEKIHGFADFLLHLFTITIGLLIALGLEGCVEWQHHRSLVAEARTNLRSEFRDNRREVGGALSDIHHEQAQVKADILALETMQANPKVTGKSLDFRFSNTRLEHASWDTARETGAFSYMPYAEVKSYAELIDLEGEFNEHEDRLTDHYTQAISCLERFNEKVPGQDIGHAAPEGIRIALDIQSELLLCENIAQALEKEYGKQLKTNSAG